MKTLSIVLACFDDFSGVYFTIQSLRMHHNLAQRHDVEILVLDNNPGSAEGQATRDFVRWISNARYVPYEGWTGTATRTLLFEQLAQGEIVLCLDAHVLLQPGALETLLKFYEQYPHSEDLIQGPMLYDDLRGLATHMDPVWRAQMWGIWGRDARGDDPAGVPFEIPMHGLGLFACRREAWLGFNHAFQGFGGEEGYIHEKFRQAGRRTLCLPGLRWLHRFPRPGGVPFPVLLHDKIRNYVIGHRELGLEIAPVLEHFSEYLPQAELQAIVAAADQILRAPPQRQLAVGKSRTVRFVRSQNNAPSTTFVKARAVPANATRIATCQFLGEATGKTHSCPTCRGNVQIKEMHCNLHEKCTVARPISEITCCEGCQDYAPTEVLGIANTQPA